MKLIQTKDYDDMSRKAANIISAQVILKPDSVLGLATGSTPIGTYKKLIEWYQKGDLDFSDVRTVNLDEYKGLTKENDQSYYYFMNENLFKHINIDLTKTNIPDGTEEDAKKECDRYNHVIESMGGIDLQLLGLGNNGHIGFNEPCDTFDKLTHCVTLTQSTIDANARFFEKIEDVPRYAYTMGIGQIMSAKKVLVVVNGKGKAEILKKVIEGPVTPFVPASILQFHPDVTIVADEEAASLLTLE
ncbi:glucosamine-6-phosphate deaminase [Velocimicrobium porci]|uniref:Glucosamine-6-phosphate deaminase n=1 Tax=Velocimicrobium porci TaxID=2606634 RepID=A0A6L5XXN2_9FIRM|nr:glucosamine-6-phosphate deaminase [Velocimicrobium porci]MSS63394.1 glucosamine-6-phosphate deaminase [Velocimicrobium porci]